MGCTYYVTADAGNSALSAPDVLRVDMTKCVRLYCRTLFNKVDFQ